MKSIRWIAAGALGLAIAAGGYYLWLQQTRSSLPEGIAQSNGRIEAEQVQIATKLAGRVVEIRADEGDMVEAGAVLARMDDAELQAQLRGAKAQADRALHAKMQVESTIAQRKSERALAQQEYQRALILHDKGYFPTEKLDQRRSEPAMTRPSPATTMPRPRSRWPRRKSCGSSRSLPTPCSRHP
jgi:HlyD family secretion protein